MKYRATLNFDYARTPRSSDKKKWTRENNALEKLKCALHLLGWSWTETSAFQIETSDVTLIWRGIALVARSATSPGEISAVTLCVQGGNVRVPSSLVNNSCALADLEQLPFP